MQFMETVAESYGLQDMNWYVEQEMWLGHSLPPELARRRYSTNGAWREDARAELGERVMAAIGDGTLARLHRKLNDAVEFTGLFGAEVNHWDFENELLDFLAYD